VVLSVVIFFQSNLIVSGMVPEDQLKWSKECCFGDKQLPIEVTYLVAEMPKQSPIWLPKCNAACFAFDVIRFAKV
jgi:hypothetical protein